MNMTTQNISALRLKGQNSIRRADAMTSMLCEMHPDQTSLASETIACIDLMLADALEYLSSADYALEEVEPCAISSESSNLDLRSANQACAAKCHAPEVARVARAVQKINHSEDLLNQAQQMIEGDRTVWGVEFCHGANWHK